MSRTFASASSQFLEKTGVQLLSDFPFTFSCWMKSSSVDNTTGGGIFVADSSTALDWIGVRIRPSDNVVWWQAQGAFNLATVATYTPGDWVHGCGVSASSTDHRVFIGGGNKITTSTSFAPTFANQDNVNIGRLGRSSPAAYMDGLIAFAAVWDIALSDAEVANLGAGLSPLLVRPANLIFYAPCAGASSPENEFVGGNHLTVTGATASNDNPKHFFPRAKVWPNKPKYRPISRHIDVPHQVFSADYRYGVPAFSNAKGGEQWGIRSVDYTLIAGSGSFSGSQSTGNTAWTDLDSLAGQEQPVPPVQRTRTSRVHGIGDILISPDDFDTEGEHSLEIVVTGEDGGKKSKSSHGGGIGLDAWNFVIDKGTLESQEIFIANSGNDTTGAGTRANPYKTIAKGVDACANAHTDTVPNNSFVTIIEAGNYDYDQNGFTATEYHAAQVSWCTVRPDPGVLTKDDVSIRHPAGQHGVAPHFNLIKFYDLTIESDGTFRAINITSAATAEHALWFDNCYFTTDKTDPADPPTGAHIFWDVYLTHAYYTNCLSEFTFDGYGIFGSTYHFELVRNCDIRNAANDGIRYAFVAYNVEMLEVSDTVYHNDLFSVTKDKMIGSGDHLSDVIAINLRNADSRATTAIIAAGTLSGDLGDWVSGCALINCYGNGDGTDNVGGQIFQSCTRCYHFLVAHCTCRNDGSTQRRGELRFNYNEDREDRYWQNSRVIGCHMTRLSIRGSSWDTPSSTFDSFIQNVEIDECNTYDSAQGNPHEWHDTTTRSVGTNWTKAIPLMDSVGIPSSSAQETVSSIELSAVEASTNLTGSLADVQDDPSYPDNARFIATANNDDTDLRVSFETPFSSPKAGSGLQTFRVFVTQFDEGQSGTPTAHVELWENGSLVRASSNEVSVPIGGVIISFTWNANELGTADGSLVECKVVGSAIGGSPSTRNSVNINSIEWECTYDAASPLLSRVSPVFPVDLRGTTRPSSASAGAYEPLSGGSLVTLSLTGVGQ